MHIIQQKQDLGCGLDDNIQTIRLVAAEIVTLKTNLLHVDIHNH